MNHTRYPLFLNNPEFTRNIWSNFSWLGLCLALFLIGNILLFAHYNSNHYTTFINLYILMFFAVVGFWGTQNIVNAFLQEFKQGTWDYQRLSTISPIQMVVGKLIGAAFLQWLIGIILLITMFIHFQFLQLPSHILPRIMNYWLATTLIILILQSLILINFLALWRKDNKKALQKKTSSSMALVILGFALYFNPWGSHSFWTTHLNPSINFFGLLITHHQYILIILSVTFIWCITGLYNLFRSEFGQKTSPLWWAACLISIYTINYGTNFVQTTQFSTLHNILPFLSMNAILTAISIYITLYYANKNAIFWVRLGRYWQYKDYRKLFYSIPYWFISYILTIILSLSTCFYHYLYPTFLSSTQLFNVTLSFLLFISRDVLLILYLNLARKGNYLVLTFLLLYLSYPLNIQIIPQGLFFPSISENSLSKILSIISPLVQIGILLTLFKTNWQKYMPSFRKEFN